MANEYDNISNYTGAFSLSPQDGSAYYEQGEYDGYATGSAMSSRSSSGRSWGNSTTGYESSFSGGYLSQGDGSYPQSPLMSFEDQTPPVESPFGIPPGFYTKVSDKDGETYWVLNTEHVQADRIQSYPPSIVCQSPENTSSNRLICLSSSCESVGNFRRKADLVRHYKTVHAGPKPPKYSCPMRKCGRVGDNGFSRDDHLKEHIRFFHHIDIPKKRTRPYHA